jgi:hypothetical protein
MRGDTNIATQKKQRACRAFGEVKEYPFVFAGIFLYNIP